MRIGDKSNLEVEHISGDVNTIKAGIDTANMGFLFDTLSRTFYSNPIGSIVREITSNCFDSHKEANVNDAVVISRDYDSEGTFISFKDVGVGLSPERMKNIYMNYFSSTKRDTDDLIGGFGLGSKTPLSYSDYFYINTKFNGKYYQYVLSKSDDVPVLDLLSESNTTDRNGTEIRIYFKNDNDVVKFSEELKKQLCYFDNVYFDGWNIDNDYCIYEGEYFKFRNKNSYDKFMHVVLGKVSYPINWDEIKEELEEIGYDKPINIACGLKFDIGELPITPNREQLRYTDEVKSLIVKRIELAINELIELYGEQNDKHNSYFGWYARKGEHPYVKFYKPGSLEQYDKCFLYGINDVEKKHSYRYFHGIESIKNVDDVLTLFYTNIGRVKDHKAIKNFDKIRSITYQLQHRNHQCYLSDKPTTSADRDYFVGYGDIFYPRIDLKRIKKHADDYNDIMYGHSLDRNGRDAIYYNLGWAKRLYELAKAIRAEVDPMFKPYFEPDELQMEIYNEWKNKNNLNLQRRLNKVIHVKSISQYPNEYDWKLSDIDKFTGLVIYGFRDDSKLISKAMRMIGSIRSNWINSYGRFNGNIIRFIQISMQNEKYFKYKPNMIHVSKLDSDNKLFRQLATILKIKLFFGEQFSDPRNFIKLMVEAAPDIGEKLEKLMSYYNKFEPHIDIKNADRSFNWELEQSIIQVANENNLFDPVIEAIFNSINKYFDGVELIRYVDVNESTIPYILKTLYDNKKRLDVEYYQRVVNNQSRKQMEFDFDGAILNSLTKFQIGTQLLV